MFDMRPSSRTKPVALKRGDTVGIIAPASNIKREMLEGGCETLIRMGYKPLYSDSIFEQDLYFAGSGERRAREFETMLRDDHVKAIICARGGYGSNYLLPLLDMNLLARNPKILVGCSDITCLLTYVYDATGIVTFHGPMAAGDFARDSVDEASWRAALEGTSEWELGASSGAIPLIEGTAEGILYGGCLSILVASLGTPYEISTEGTILFIEDVAAKPYQIDRMLMQLKLAGKLSKVKGIIFGEMLDCRQNENQGYTLQEVILRIVGDLKVPLAYGLRSGHVTRDSITLPIGVPARLSVERDVKLEFPESATFLESTRSSRASVQSAKS
jgi:muramoyltetrapeptide carboxypeptidase